MNKCLVQMLAIAGVFWMAGCGGDKIEVSIFDRQTETRVAVSAGMTVEEALIEAEIAIGEGDVVSPSLGEVISEDGTDIFLKRHASIVIVEDGQRQEMDLTGGQVKDAVAEAGITLGKYDEINHDLQAYLVNGMDIQVLHRHLVTIDADGEVAECLTASDTVAELLQEKNIRLDKKDQITPELNTELKDGMKVEVQRVFVERVSEYEEIPYDTKVEYSGSMFEDETRKKQQGRNGKKELVYEVTYVDGREERRNLVEEKVVIEPVSSIVVKGTAARRRIVSKEEVYDCDGSGHGYYVITWSDGVVEYEDF